MAIVSEDWHGVVSGDVWWALRCWSASAAKYQTKKLTAVNNVPTLSLEGGCRESGSVARFFCATSQ